MHEQQSPKHFELGQRVVTGLHSVHPLLAIDAHSDVRLFNHRDVVATIANSKANLA